VKWIVLSEYLDWGDIVPADALLLPTTDPNDHLQLDQSALTGEYWVISVIVIILYRLYKL
jgi:magnesium-transporting ATPase (P-type)